MGRHVSLILLLVDRVGVVDGRLGLGLLVLVAHEGLVGHVRVGVVLVIHSDRNFIKFMLFIPDLKSIES